MTTDRKCTDCAKPITQRSTTGRCRACHLRSVATNPNYKKITSDPAHQAKAGRKGAEALNKLMRHRPDVRERQRKASADFNRTPHMRATSAKIAASITDSDRRKGYTNASAIKQAARVRAKALADIPPELRADYVHLTKCKRFTAQEARTILATHEQARLDQLRRVLTDHANRTEAEREAATCSHSE